jgi:hypothetical protein
MRDVFREIPGVNMNGPIQILWMEVVPRQTMKKLMFLKEIILKALKSR